MFMKSINVAELKSGLSRYLRRVRRGERFVVMDRKEPIAELIPLERNYASTRERLIREGHILPATKRMSDVRITPLGREVHLQDLLEEVREDST